MTLWKRDGAVEKNVERYTVGDDYILDKKLLVWDGVASRAHARGLRRIGILTQDELDALEAALSQAIALAAQDKFEITVSQEDGHTALEEFLVAKCGAAGKKIHTGRSRNDQVLTALKLFIKAELVKTQELLHAVGDRLIQFAGTNPVAMPGYTHMQRAMPSSASFWAEAFAESMLDNISLLHSTYVQLDSSPLGSAAGYGVSLPLDRAFTAQELKFERVQVNALYVQNSRGKNEALVLSALGQVMLDLNKLASDLLLFSTAEFGFFILPEEFCTGSSIMPQKRNPDVLELMRAKAKQVQALHFQVVSTVSDLPSGYNRDFQLTKRPLMEGFEIVQSSLQIIAELIPGITVNRERCEAALDPSIYQADIALQAAARGVPFRDAYHEVKQGDSRAAAGIDPYQHLKCKSHIGAPGNLQLESLQHKFQLVAQELAGRQEKLKAITFC